MVVDADNKTVRITMGDVKYVPTSLFSVDKLMQKQLTVYFDETSCRVVNALPAMLLTWAVGVAACTSHDALSLR